MAKKLILLLLLIPIIIMICLFAATKTISNLVDVPVSGIEIVDTNSHIYLDLDKGETYSLECAVYPTNAKNKNITVSTEAVDGKNLAALDFTVQDNSVKITPKTAGSAKVYLTTIDGGFKDSVMLHVESTALKSIECSTAKSTLAIGESVSINTTFIPAEPSDTVCLYESSNPKVATVDDNGIIKAVGKGTATITVISEYNPDIKDTLTIEVYNKDVMDLIETEIIGFNQNGKIPIYIDKTNDFKIENLSYKAYDESGNELADAIEASFVAADGELALFYSFVDPSFYGEITVKLSYSDENGTVTKECRVSRVQEMTVSFTATGAIGLTKDSRTQIPFVVTPQTDGLIYTVAVSNDNATATMSGSRLTVVGKKAGVATVTLTVTKAATADSPEQIKSISIDVAVKPANLTVSETANTYGIENVITIGRYEYDYTSSPAGTLVETSTTANKLSLHFATFSELGDGFYENFTWMSHTAGVEIDKDGNVSFISNLVDEIVNFEGIFSYQGVTASTGVFGVRCVGEGVNVYSYKDLLYATRSEHPVVVRNNIKEDFGYINGVPQYTEIHTTYDDTYYKNTGNLAGATVKILIEFKNDVYGNGHTINAHNIVYGIDPETKALKDSALFRGPLDFVAMHETSSSITVKGQDNICFALYEGVTVNNVELRGCDLTADDGKVDLVDLGYTGTTVEVLGDNVNIEYSRLTNGRTVLRAFGDINDSTKVINVNVKNSVLSGAREFIMRVGSNCFVDGTLENPSPKLPGDSGSDYNAKTNYRNMSADQKAAYEEKYIKTFITVKNSVFKDAGLFAIGMDSHFSGTALADGHTFVNSLGAIGNLFKKGDGTLIDSWLGLAKTSYGAKLTFEGDVKLYCWKDLENVDSTTLINVPETSAFNGKIDFDVQAMIKALSEKPGYTGITHKDGDTSYVHAGIAFFGGGKNYSIFDTTDSKGYGLTEYAIGLDTVDRDYFVYAAGYEDFYFFMYSANSEFTPAVQSEMLSTDKGYECIYKK